MKHSIRTRMMVVLILSFTMFMGIIWVLNGTLLSQFYEHEKLSELEQTYVELENCYGSDDISNEQLEINRLATSRLCENTGMNIYVFNLYQIYNRYFPTMVIYPQNMDIQQVNTMTSRIKNYLYYYYDLFDTDDENDTEDDSGEEKRTCLLSKENYGIYKVFDAQIGSYYLELFGTLSNQTGVYVRTNYQQIHDSVRISNRFLLYVGIIILSVTCLVMFFLSDSITRPILELNDIARNMSQLKFDKKYTTKRKDELGRLGDSINSLSDSLERAMSELKGANNELRRDIEKKEKIDEMRRDFLSNVSHELKTPIALIQGYAEGLMENISEDKESQDFYCEVIADEANKMNQMVKKLLNLNNLEFGSSPVEFEHFDLVSVMKSVLNSFQIVLEQKKITLNLSCPESAYVWADEYWVEEVITNYISNALNHIKPPEILDIKMIKEDGILRTSVINTGDNIPEEDIDKIWIKFYKVDKARTREYGGNGIGLSIVKAVMDSMNQKCGVKNLPEGVEFWFELDTGEKNIDLQKNP